VSFDDAQPEPRRRPGKLDRLGRWFEGRRRPTPRPGPPGLPSTEVADDATATEFMNPRRIVRRGGFVVLGFVAIFFGWGAFAPLDSALLAPGVIVVESHRKTIQHLEGGIVQDILVREGQAVRPGQALIRLDTTQAKASFDMLQGQADALAAQEARLIAQKDNAPNVAFPSELMTRASDPKVADAMRVELNAFTNARETTAKQLEILRTRIQENNRSIEGLRAQLRGIEQQVALIAREQEMIKVLVDRGIESLPRLLALQRAAADLGGQRGQVIEKISEVQVSNGETELQMVNLKNTLMADVLKELRDVQGRRFDLMDRLKAARDIMYRQVITTPVEGRVVSLAVHGRGAVIRAGEAVMEIVPQKDQLEVEAHVRPEDIDNLHVGMSAKVTLSGNQARRIPAINGTVTVVSADRLVDQQTGMAYFNAKVAVDRKALEEYPDIRLVPGMPVEVAIETGERTMVSYFWSPIESVFRKGMRER
jgi:HlyD family type I secretion membrane fusion protein